MVNDIKILKQKYDLMVNGSNPDVARLVLHLEGDGSQYPSIFTLTEKERVAAQGNLIQSTLPYILLAYTLGIIKYQDRMDGTGKKAYCIAKEDEDGYPLPPVILGEKITQFLDSTALDEDLCAEIKTIVMAQLADEYLHVTKRGELDVALKNEMKTTVLPECKNNPSDPVFVKFREAATEAGKILKN